MEIIPLRAAWIAGRVPIRKTFMVGILTRAIKKTVTASACSFPHRANQSRNRRLLYQRCPAVGGRVQSDLSGSTTTRWGRGWLWLPQYRGEVRLLPLAQRCVEMPITENVKLRSTPGIVLPGKIARCEAALTDNVPAWRARRRAVEALSFVIDNDRLPPEAELVSLKAFCLPTGGYLAMP